MKKIIVISLLVIFMFLVSCVPQMTDEELEAELAKLTPEQREELLADLESKGNSAFAGQAVAKKYGSSKISSANVQQMKSMLENMSVPYVNSPNTEVCGNGICEEFSFHRIIVDGSDGTYQNIDSVVNKCPSDCNMYCFKKEEYDNEIHGKYITVWVNKYFNFNIKKYHPSGFDLGELTWISTINRTSGIGDYFDPTLPPGLNGYRIGSAVRHDQLPYCFSKDLVQTK
ncbi:MAG: hypothetical protein AABX24_02830 [Nanoarchaeota archaeon]